MARVIGSVDLSFRSGPNRVISMCSDAGIPAPEFEEITGAAVVTFRVNVAGAAQRAQQVTGQVAGQLLRFCQTPRKASEIQKLLGLRHRESFQNNYLKPLLEMGWLERTIPDKPRSRMQKYKTTEAGQEAVKRNER